ncbi:CHASE2 domain-containing protein [candidate division KSB1 bacterium]|nr:CHASE2 domain-containing protein [candidate division KSB1 bacterium]NIR71877.1 CHASE2 domain-containing protein [candidate division KSB1 bacterium]NIS26444.1 CHASE2 domain-containing protein [candidate division KSB1 bacterium]NIT73214.1 CHASE2 domain-containing protein [candidate division KSB1 bacterium]NIU27128.1 CHASE2 domain-containing protein [candidate division KSB1 bacterium]
MVKRYEFVFRNRKFLKLIAVLLFGLLASVLLFWNLVGTVWTVWDYQILDLFYRLAIKFDYGPPSSPKIVYLYITDNSYDYFGKHILDRSDLARIKHALVQFGPEAVAYDIIFARPSDSVSDQRFKESIEHLGNVYLPVAFELAEESRPFKWEAGTAFERLKSDFLAKPNEMSTGHPFYAVRALMQADAFAQAAVNTGHINALSDADGVYRQPSCWSKSTRFLYRR